MTVSILTEEEKQRVRELFVSGGYTKSSLASAFCVSARTIGRILEKPRKEVEVQEEEETKEIDNPHHHDIGMKLFNDEDNDVRLYEYKFVYTPSVITIQRKGTHSSVQTETITSADDRFQSVVDLILTKGQDQQTLEEAFNIVSVSNYIENITFGNITVDRKENCLIYTYPGSEEQVKFESELANRVISAIVNDEQESVKGLIAFAEKLAWCSDQKVISQLYKFLNASDIKINEDGFVVCYKRVTYDFKDCYTKKIDNSIGARPKVKRDYVDSNPNQTCSRGLHVCSWAYLKHYRGDRIIKVLVDPADFVAIPEDYYQTSEGYNVQAKARVCEYYVVEEIEEFMEHTPSKQFDTWL